ncbi:MAG TPA: c-type cytochrome domain-containing protein, partial [Bryobacteraceae bacterium]|nr:c-type cytochrome domain-containing protein [Bryobacteraceae bacterium]
MRRLLWVIASAGALWAQSPEAEFFEKRIRPVFAARCYGCHGDKVKMGGLNLSSSAGLAHATQAGALTKGDPEQSRLYRALLYTEGVKMPPTGKLPPEEIAAVRDWIQNGAHVPSAAPASAAPPKGVSDEDRKHWAFQPVRKPALPKISQQGWARTPI